MPATRVRDVPINMEATCSPVDPDDWAVSFAMCHTPRRIFVDNLTEMSFDKKLTHVYVERRTCGLYHPNCSDFNYACKSCGEQFSTCDKPRFCPGCGAEIVK